MWDAGFGTVEDEKDRAELEEARRARQHMRIVLGELQALYNKVHTTRAKVLVAAMLAHQDDLIRGMQLLIASIEATTSG